MEMQCSLIPHIVWNLWGIYTYNSQDQPLHIVALFIAGVLGWTLLEYLLHRFLFHSEDYWLMYLPWNKVTHSAHFFCHGIHHAFPQDRLRINFPPALGQIAIWMPLIAFPLYKILPANAFYAFHLGVVIGYQIYEFAHWVFHHTNPSEGYIRDMKLYHMQHHYKFGTVGFGVSSKFWDQVFNTPIEKDNKTKTKWVTLS